MWSELLLQAGSGMLWRSPLLETAGAKAAAAALPEALILACAVDGERASVLSSAEAALDSAVFQRLRSTMQGGEAGIYARRLVLSMKEKCGAHLVPLVNDACVVADSMCFEKAVVASMQRLAGGMYDLGASRLRVLYVYNVKPGGRAQAEAVDRLHPEVWLLAGDDGEPHVVQFLRASDAMRAVSVISGVHEQYRKDVDARVCAEVPFFRDVVRTGAFPVAVRRFGLPFRSARCRRAAELLVSGPGRAHPCCCLCGSARPLVGLSMSNGRRLAACRG
jgi:hypothetical protein